jgi:predicted unusual protein kinase regulating ubiquinone biosynthesis (AarF/ABC1/UbiB family)
LELVKSDVTTGTLARGYRIGKLGVSLVGSYLGYQAQNLLLGKDTQPQRRARFHQQLSQQVRNELGALKGPAMKFGQMLSMQTEFLSEEALQELANLQMQAPPMHTTLARAQFKSALGKYPEDAFREFDAEPFAAASLGQVHRAVTKDGEKVAVKIQYPAIRSAIENDLKLLRSATLPTQVTGHMPSALLDEIARGLLEETDYLHEADNLDYFRKGLSALPYVTVPRVRRDLTTDRVLTMSFVEGESFSKWLKRNPSRAMRDLMGVRLCEAYEMQLQHLRVLHADQHPGNYLFQPDGRFGLVDFGCVKRVNFDVVELHRCYEKRSWRENEAAARHLLEMVYGKNVPFARARKILPLLEELMDVYQAQGVNGDFVVDVQNHPKKNPKVKEIQRRFLQQTLQDKLINPDFVYIVRADMGFWHLVGEIGATVNVSEISRSVSATPPDTR